MHKHAVCRKLEAFPCVSGGRECACGSVSSAGSFRTSHYVAAVLASEHYISAPRPALSPPRRTRVSSLATNCGIVSLGRSCILQTPRNHPNYGNEFCVQTNRTASITSSPFFFDTHEVRFLPPVLLIYLPLSFLFRASLSMPFFFF